MFSVSSITMIVVVAFLIVLKKLYEVGKHYQRPPHFPPGPSQVQTKVEIQCYCFIIIILILSRKNEEIYE